MENNSRVNTRSFNKGMVKDLNDTYTGEGTWTHARNAVNNSEYGDIGVLGNEPANIKCVDIPFTVIGSISLGGGNWAIYSTNIYGDYVDSVEGNQSEIGLFNENDCTYNTIVNDKNSTCKLNFDQLYPIIGVSKSNSDCSVQLYWDDGSNPSRTMNIGDPAQWPYTIDETQNPPLHWDGVPYVQRDIDNDPECKNLVDTIDLDCDKLRLATLTDTPCITISKGEGLGTLPNGTYQATIAYTVNQIRVTDYLSFSNLQPLWTHENLTGSIDIDFTNLDSDYDEFELVVISSINQQTVCKRIGVYSTNTQRVSLDAINAELETIPIENIPLRTPSYEKTDAMFAVNDYLIRVGPTTNFDFNYQPLANNISTKWVATYYPSDYYYKGGNKPSFMRDEVYSFFIRWVYKTGDKSSSYHIPGRPAIPARDLYSVASPDGDNGDGQPLPRWRIESTATITDRPTDTRTDDGGLVFAKGQMGYWESTERYPDNNPDVWGDLCGKPIRHHKMPEDFIYDDQRRGVEQVKLYNNDFDSIAVLGVEFENIEYPVDNDGKPIPNLIGYEILVGSREGHRSIIAKGLINNMREYTIPDEDRTGLYVNYPYNSSKPDPFLAIDRSRTDQPYKQSKGGAYRDDDNFYDTDGKGDLILFGNSVDTTRFGVRNDIFSFHSPETTFRNPFLSATELRVYADVNGDVKGRFILADDHPKAKLITDVTFILASAAGAAIGKSAATEAGGGIAAAIGDFIKSLALTAINPVLGAASFAKDKLEDVILFSYFFIESTDNIMEGIKGFAKYQQYALQYVSHGFYNRFEAVPINERRRILTKSNYLQPSLQDFTEDFRINNIQRSKTVVIRAKEALALYREYNNGVEDNTLFTLKHIAKNRAGRTRPSGYGGDIDAAEKAVYKEPWAFPQTSLTIAKYGALKVDLENQYGQLEQIKQLPAGCIQLIDYTPGIKYSSTPIFGGDVYINRYTEKNTFFYFSKWMENLPDGTEYDYRLYNMLPYPRYWMDTSTFDTANFFSGLIDKVGSVLSGDDTSSDTLPNDKSHLDRRGAVSGFFILKNAYMYLFNSGVRDFYVESEINLALRDYEQDPGKRHYDFQTYTDYESMFDMDNIRDINYYKYDYSLSKVKYYSYFLSWGNLQPRSYDPYVYSSCYTHLPERVIYSLQQQYELDKDNWRQFLANNYYDFDSNVTSIRSVGGSGAILMFESESPIVIQGAEQINLNSGTALTIGDGGLFNNQPLKNLVNADDELEYGSCQSRLSVINTPGGVFYVSIDQGRVFNFTNGLADISKAGMKWWFQEYGPYKITEDFPDFELLDNTIVGVGVQTVYDNDNEIVYFTKRDFKLRPEYKGQLTYIGDGVFRRLPRQRNIFLGDPTFFEDASWTVSYDPKTKAWISFHDWHPNLTLPGRKTFLTIKGKTIWKHNDRCDLYANYYDTNYPFEIEYVQNQGQEVTTTRNVEYALECYKYDDECYDKYHLLTENFDSAVIYNSEQISGQLNLVLSPVSAYAQLSYPIINPASIDILYSKVEQKYRFNQFWDITNDRAVEIPMWDTEANGYIRNINPIYVNYNKGATERKKFRHYINKVLLSKAVSGSAKFLFKVINNKLLKSFR